MFAAANSKGGAGGVPQSVGKEFATADEGGKLPEKVKKKGWVRKAEAKPAPKAEKPKASYSVLYDHPRSRDNGKS
jgi:hypothetical protein